MPYLGNDPGKLGTVLMDSFTGDGSAVAFTLIRQPPNADALIVAVDGVVQHPTGAWSVSTNTLTFSTAPDSGAEIRVWHLSSSNTVDTVEDNAITLAKMAGGTDGNIISYDASGNPVAVATGTDGQVLTSAGAGAPPAFEAASGGVDTTGTPADNQIAIFTDSDTVEGDSGLTFSGTQLYTDGDFKLVDDKGIILGTGSDYWLGLNAGETELELVPNGAQGADGTEGKFSVLAGDGASSTLTLLGGEAGSAIFYLQCDQGDDTDDRWFMPVQVGYSSYLYLDNQANTVLQTYRFQQGGSADADGTWNDDAFDYAELFEWELPLETDIAVKDLYGLSVVQVNGKVRIAEAGEEAQVIGIVRAKGSTNTHGDGLRWKSKYKKDVWGVHEYEPYVMVNWQQDGYRHGYHSDEIPPYRLRDDVGRDRNWHLKEEYFAKDKDGEKIPVVVPETDEEKQAVNYTERTVHKSSGEPLTRRMFDDSYDETQAYIRREDRPKEWVLIGLLGQVPVRDGAIIPDQWIFMESLEAGVDKYLIK